MKIYIFADMEGITGVSGSDFVLPGQCPLGRRSMLLYVGH